MRRKYIAVGGWVHSIMDADKHFVSAPEVARLYGLQPQECYIASSAYDAVWNDDYPNDCIILKPQYTGKYVLPEPRS